MSGLFSSLDRQASPLPARVRPETWEGYVGQDELRKELKGRPIHSMILYGPPGCGKTTLARILASESGRRFSALSAVSCGVKEVRAVIEEGRASFLDEGKGALLFLDEIHRFSRSQQDALLEAVESGWVILMGATTENPAFSVIAPLLSRCRVYRLRPLDPDSLEKILDRALRLSFSGEPLRFSPEARRLLLESAHGDARRLLGFVEHARSHADKKEIDVEKTRTLIEGQLRNYDKTGENHYDFISAFIKCLRGSDPDAALLYMAVMLEAGEDPLFLARRMLIFASEDVGNASPQALSLALSAYEATERLGMPEARIVLGQLATFLAACPKSNASYRAIDQALDFVKNRSFCIPNHLRNAPTKIHKEEGAGEGYEYPHDFAGHFVKKNYFPEGVEPLCFYEPASEGKEDEIRNRLSRLWPERYKSFSYQRDSVRAHRTRP